MIINKRYWICWLMFNMLIHEVCPSFEDWGGDDFATMAKKSKQKKMPQLQNGEPMKVYVGFYVESMGSIKATEMAYDLDVYLRMSWRDNRLRHNEDMIVINDLEIMNKIWVPDIFFANAKKADFQHVTVPNLVLYVEKDGTCSYSARVTMNVACNLDFREFPLDRQQCHIKIMSYAHTRNEMNVTWFRDDPIKGNPDIDLPEFEIVGSSAKYCDATFKYAITDRSYRRGEFSCLIATFKLTRALGYHLVQTYIPTGLIVVISWVSFWIDRNAVPARVSLSFTTLLTLSTMGAGLRYSLPAVSYAKAIDFWFGTCMLFIFGALLEFAVVNSLMRRSKKYELLAAEKKVAEATAWGKGVVIVKTPNGNYDDDSPTVTTTFIKASDIEAEELEKLKIQYARKALRVDLGCRIVFPIIFLIFNCVHWFYYLKF